MIDINSLENGAPVSYRFGTYGETKNIWRNWKAGKLYITKSKGKVVSVGIHGEEHLFRPSEFHDGVFCGERFLLELKD